MTSDVNESRTDERSEQGETGTEHCLICDKPLKGGADGHWMGDPGDHTPHVYHTNRRHIARRWEHIEGLDVTPSTEPYSKGTLGDYRGRC